MVVLAVSICTRGGKPVLSRQFREMPRSRIEGLLAALPKLADTGTQHTTIETENVRYVYQPLEELYMVLITNKQSNILQDIDSLHLFAQVTQSICKSMEERELLKHAFELLSAFDEVVSLGYKENLSLSQIRTFLEMESHEERIQEIIARNKEFEASEERKRKAKQLELQRKELARSQRGISAPRQQSFTSYQSPPPRSPSIPTYDQYEAEKKKTVGAVPKGKGMQLGKKSKTTDMFEKVRNELGVTAEETAPLVGTPQPTSIGIATPSRTSISGHPLSVIVNEQISAELSREGAIKSFEIKGDLQLRISDPSLSKIKLQVTADESNGTQFKTHPNVDKAAWSSGQVIQARDLKKGFPAKGESLGVLRWKQTAKPGDDSALLPVTFTVWMNHGSGNHYTVTVEYELMNNKLEDGLKNVVVSIPFQSSEPVVSNLDEVYEVTGDGIDWNIGNIDHSSSSGSFEFEAQAEDESEFFPMSVRFMMGKPVVNVDVTEITLVEEQEQVDFHKEVKSVASGYTVT